MKLVADGWDNETEEPVMESVTLTSASSSWCSRAARRTTGEN